jgi:hypothetical protein
MITTAIKRVISQIRLYQNGDMVVLAFISKCPSNLSMLFCSQYSAVHKQIDALFNKRLRFARFPLQ